MDRVDCWCAKYRKPCQYHEGSQDALGAADRLAEALGRTLANFEAVLARRSVRDATETIEEARHVLAEYKEARDGEV